MNTKKELTEAIKKTAKENENFRNLYNDLSDEEKNTFKEKFLNDLEIQNQIIKHHIFDLDKLQETVALMFKQEAYNKGFKKPRGKKARAYFLNKVSVYYLGDYGVGIKPVLYTKRGVEYCFYFLLKVPTSKGNIYVDFRDGFKNEAGDEERYRHVAYTAHFFDRYKERLGLEGDRDDAVDEFINSELANLERGSAMSSSGGQVTFNLAKGLGLGISTGENLLIKTFISQKEINHYQEKEKKELIAMQKEQK